MSNDPFATPGAPGSGITWADHKGELLLIEVLESGVNINTAYGESEAVRANVVVLQGLNPLEEYNDTLIFPKVLQGQLRNKVGQKVLGRLSQGQAKPGQSAPWMLTDPDEQDRKTGLEYLAQNTLTSASPPF